MPALLVQLWTVIIAQLSLTLSQAHSKGVQLNAPFVSQNQETLYENN